MNSTPKNPGKPHKHAAAIAAWAYGARIEFKTNHGSWGYVEKPSWYEDQEYRVEQAPAPDIVRYFGIDKYNGADNCMTACLFESESIINLREYKYKVTFDGTTRELKSLEQI